VSQAARRHGRLSQGEAATITAVAPAISNGSGNAALASHEPCARLPVSATGCPSPSRSKIPAATPAATAAAAASPPSRRNRRRRSVAATTSAAAATHATCTMPVTTLLAAPNVMPPTAASGPSSQRCTAFDATSDTSSKMLPAISRITSPGCR